jgi:hypothetical protein
VKTVTAVDPFSLTKNKIVNSPYCLIHPEVSPCNGYRLKAQDAN